MLLHDLAITFTYDDALRQALPTAWPPVMEAALNEIEATPDLSYDRHWSSTALASLVPVREPDLADANFGASIGHVGLIMVPGQGPGRRHGCPPKHVGWLKRRGPQQVAD